MKKVLIIGIALLMLVAVTACGIKRPAEKTSVSEIESSIEESSIAESSEESSASDTSFATSEVTSKATDGGTSVASTAPAIGGSSTGIAWKDYVNDYTALVDRYVSIVDRQMAKPTDLSILSEYSAIIEELSAFNDEARLAAVQASIGTDLATMAEFTAALEVQSQRVTDAMAKLQQLM